MLYAKICLEISLEIACRFNKLSYLCSRNQWSKTINTKTHTIMKTISYSDAVKRFNNNLILCNNIPEFDLTIYDNVRFPLFDEHDDAIDIYQWYITDCTENDVLYLEDWYNLKFTYSEMLDKFILCVDHWGTPWNGVMIEDRSEC